MMQYKGYIGKVEYDAEAAILHGEVIGIRDVVTFQGRSVDEVNQAFRESVDDYLNFCKERGEEPNHPFSGQFVLRIGADLHRSLTMLAQAAGKSLNAFVAECLGETLKHAWPLESNRVPSRPRVSATAPTRKKQSAGRQHGTRVPRRATAA
ncbi:MAG: type II toxin-antitoxin system HicB family antitoxin [Tepidisphaeraceae bacterium]|jgi:predicted HicB family RNase H-like nuclease